MRRRRGVSGDGRGGLVGRRRRRRRNVARPKKPSGELGSLAECNEALHELLLVTLQLEGLRADRDRKRAEADAAYEPAIDTATRRAADLEAQLQHYYVTHLPEVEKDGKRSVQLYWGVLGQRLGNPALKLLNKSWTWGAVLVKLRAKFGDRFIRTREPEIDKDLAKAELDAAALRDCGLKVDQDEKFYAEPDRGRSGEV